MTAIVFFVAICFDLLLQSYYARHGRSNAAGQLMSVTYVNFLTMRGKVFTNTAKCFPANADIGGDHVLGDALYTPWIGLSEF